MYSIKGKDIIRAATVLTVIITSITIIIIFIVNLSDNCSPYSSQHLLLFTRKSISISIDEDDLVSKPNYVVSPTPYISHAANIGIKFRNGSRIFGGVVSQR